MLWTCLLNAISLLGFSHKCALQNHGFSEQLMLEGTTAFIWSNSSFQAGPSKADCIGLYPDFFFSISKVEDSTCASTQSSLTVKKLFLDVQRKPPGFVPRCLWSCHWTQLKAPWLCLYTLPWSNCICYWGIDQIPLRLLFPNLNRPISLSISLQERSFSPFTIFMLSLTCLQ